VQPIGDDFKGSSLKVETGGELVPGLVGVVGRISGAQSAVAAKRRNTLRYCVLRRCADMTESPASFFVL
jgi:hypothetical protein